MENPVINNSKDEVKVEVVVEATPDEQSSLIQAGDGKQFGTIQQSAPVPSANSAPSTSSITSFLHRVAAGTVLTGNFAENSKYKCVDDFAIGYRQGCYSIAAAAVTLGIIDWAAMPYSQGAFSASLGAYLPTEAWYWIYPSLFIAMPLLAGFVNAKFPATSNQNKYTKWANALGKDEANNYPRYQHIGFTALTALSYLAMLGSHGWLGAVWVNKAIKSGNHQTNLIDCVTRGMTLVYMPDYGGYQCAVCPDWNFVAPANVFTVQDCLDGLLTNVNEAETIIKNLKEFDLSQVTKVDLSKLDWGLWKLKQFKQFFQILMKKISKLDEMDLSLPAGNVIARDDSKKLIYLFEKVFGRIQVNRIKANNRHMGKSLAEPFIKGVKKAKSTWLEASHNDFENDGGNALFVVIPSTDLRNVNISYNKIGSEPMQKLANDFPPLLETLNIAGNLHKLPDVELLLSATTYDNSSLTTLITSDVNLSASGKISKIITGVSTIHSFDISHTGVSGATLYDLFDTFKFPHLKDFDGSYNPVTTEEWIKIIRKLLEYILKMEDLNLSGTSISDNKFNDLVTYVNQTGAHQLGFADLNLSEASLINLFGKLSPEEMFTVDISRGVVTLEFTQSLSVIMQKHPKLLRALKMNEMGLDDKTAKPIILALKISELETLMMNSNNLSDDIISAAEKFSNISLLHLYIDDNNLELQKLTRAIVSQQFANLQTFSVKSNPVNKNVVNEMGPYLVEANISTGILLSPVIPQYEALQFQQSKKISNLKSLTFSPGLFSKSSKRASELLATKDVQIHPAPERTINSTSNTADSIYLGFSMAPWVTRMIVGMVALYMVLNAAFKHKNFFTRKLQLTADEHKGAHEASDMERGFQDIPDEVDNEWLLAMAYNSAKEIEDRASAIIQGMDNASARIHELETQEQEILEQRRNKQEVLEQDDSKEKKVLGQRR